MGIGLLLLNLSRILEEKAVPLLADEVARDYGRFERRWKETEKICERLQKVGLIDPLVHQFRWG